jgi:prefoldin subunit 1
VETTQKAKNLNMSIMQGEKDIRRAALTGAELSALPEDVGCYKGLGRSFVKEPKSAVMETLENTVKASRAEIEQCTLQREHLKKTLAETETNIKELLQGNEALSRELLQNGYQ